MSRKDPYAEREAAKYEKPIASRELLLSIIEQSTVPLTLKAVISALNYGNDKDRKERG